MTKYYICGGSDDFWMPTNATTLDGAKAIASKTYQQAVGGKIKVAEVEDGGDQYITVAVKYGCDKWQQA